MITVNNLIKDEHQFILFFSKKSKKNEQKYYFLIRDNIKCLVKFRLLTIKIFVNGPFINFRCIWRIYF